MRLCVSCGNPLEEDARADAKHCRNERCRSKEYRRRKKEAGEKPKPATKHAVAEQSFVVRCSCGSRLRIQISHMEESEAEPVETSVPSEAAPQSEQGPPPIAVAHHETPRQAPAAASPQPALTLGLRTYELFAMSQGRAVPLVSAFRRPELRGGLREGFKVVIGDAPEDGFGLAGVPGRWRHFYDARSPTEFGQDADKAVMYWEPKDAAGRGVALSAEVLSQLYGRDWRRKVYGADGA